MKTLITKILRVTLVSAFLLTTVVVIGSESSSESALTFSGSEAYQVVLPKNAISPKSLTVSAWVKTSDPQKSQGILSVGEPSRFFTFYIYREGVRMLVENGDGESPRYDYALAPLPVKNEWTHYCGSYDGKTIRIYRNGRLAQEKTMPTTLTSEDFDGQVLWIGGVAPNADRPFLGEMNDLAVWSKALTTREVERVYQVGASKMTEGRIAFWNSKSRRENSPQLVPLETQNVESLTGKLFKIEPLLNRKDTGYRGIWYYNQKLDNEYVYKYSGGLGTYPANHYPFSVYRPEVDKTFFCYGGFDPSEQTLWHEVGVFDHKTQKVSRPTILVDKQTNDAHDNPVMTIDDDGYIWVLSTSHGTGRPSFIHRSVRPYDASEFEKISPTKLVAGTRVPMNNFSYVQIWNVPQRGFISFFTTYDRSLVAKADPDSKAQRLLAFMTSSNGIEWSAWNPLAAIEIGHYQNACVHYDLAKTADDGKPAVKIGTAFNYHPAVAKGNRGVGLNWRTNLYYMESNDLGKTWQTIDGQRLETPLLSSDSPAKIYDYESENLNVYVTDAQFDSNGNPIVAYVTSKGFESGPEMGPRHFHTARWTGEKWEISTVCEVDNNYEYAMIYPEEADSEILRLVGSFEDGPQAYNTGGEISQWISVDNGKTWNKEYQLTQNSEVNQCFPRRTIDADPDFYAFWAEGNGRKKSISTLRFSTKDGKVYALPRDMKDDWERPILIREASKEFGNE